MANLLKTFTSSIDIVNGPVHQIFPEPVVLARTSVVEDYKVISLVANESFAVVTTISNNGVIVDLSSPTTAKMNASVFDNTSLSKVPLAASFDAGLSDLANGVIAFICPIDVLPSSLATGFDRKPNGTIEIDFEIKVGGFTVYMYDRVNVIDNNFGGTGGTIPVAELDFVSKGETVTTDADEVQLGVQAASGGQTVNVFEANNSAGTTNGGFNEDGFAFGLAKAEITGKTEVSAVAGDHVLISDASDSGELKKVLASDFLTVSHATSHTDGSDDIQSATDSQKGLATAAQITKLDAIEALADVTDEANVVSSLDGATLTSVTVTGTDKVILQDDSDSDNIKTVTAQSIADLAGSGGLYRDIYIDAAAMVPRETNGAEALTKEFATNDIMIDYLAFDSSTEEGVQFKMMMPDEWDRSTIKLKFYWDGAVTASGTVIWGVKAGALSDDDAIDAALGTQVTVTDTLLAVGDMHVSPATAAITVGGAPELEDMIIFQVVATTGGTISVDQLLMGVGIQYKESATVQTIW